MNNILKFMAFSNLFIIGFLFKPFPASAFDFRLENKTNNDYFYTIELDADDTLDVGDRLILTGLSGVTDAAANSPYSIDKSDFDLTSANFEVDTATSGSSILTGVISLTSADSLDDLEYKAFYTDKGTPRVASNNITTVPFNPSTDLGILLLLSGFGCHRLKHRLKRQSNNNQV